VFWLDFPNYMLLFSLYTLQGLFMGVIFTSLSLVFKKYLTYVELGKIMMCTTPFTLKLFWAPIIEFYYLKRFGKRKSWVVPTQMVIFVVLMWFKDELEPMVLEKKINMVTAILTFIIFVITCQDIAVDAWAVEILRKENTEYGSTCQSLGMRIGFFISGTVFISLSDQQFC